MKTRLKLTNKEIKELLGAKSFDFPKYSTQLLNLANQNAQGTRPKIVGQMSELIQEFSGKNIQEWEDWYLKTHSDAIEKATKKITEMIENLKIAMNQIDHHTISEWVRDLVIIKTFIGLRFHEAIMIKVAQLLNKNYVLATPEQESQGIDGFIGNIPVSIKPETYKTKKNLGEEITSRFIYYRKEKDGITIDISTLMPK